MRPITQPIHHSLVVLLLLLIHSGVKAQNKTTITGSLLDSSNNKPVAWATTGLYKKDNTAKPLQNIFSDNKGRFEFTAVDTGNYVVIVTYAGYTEKEFPVRIDSGVAKKDIGSLILSPASKELGNVVVTAAARKPLLEQEDEKMIYNTEADPSVEGLTAIDVFRKTPFLSVDGDGNVQLNGQSNFKVLLNGKETSMFSKNLKEALKSFPANLIKKVEVSTNPSSKYDGEGVGGIINIITKKRVMGYNGNLSISRNTIGNYNGNASINFKYGKWGLTGYYGFGGGRPPGNTSSSEMESLHPVAFYKRISNGNSRNKYFYNYGNVELSWDMDSLHTFSSYVEINGGNGSAVSSTRYNMILPSIIDTISSSLYNESNYKYPSVNYGIDFIKKFKGNTEKEWTVKFYQENSKDDNFGEGIQETPGLQRFVINDNKSKNEQTTVQTDWVQPIKKDVKIEFGLKAILRRANSDYMSYYKYDVNGKYEVDINNSDKFNYHQNVYSAYTTYRFKWKQISFKIGARLEHTSVEGNFIKNGTSVKQDYNTLMPNVYLSRKFNKIHTFSLQYGKRLRRPYIWDLNPFVNNTDSLNIYYGNPGLDPDIIHMVEIGYSVFKGNTNINFRLSESFSGQQITRYSTFDDATGVLSNVVNNGGISKVTGLNGNLSTKFTKKWSFSTGMGLRYTFIKNRYRPEQKNQGLGGYIYWNSGYELTKKWNVTVNFNGYRGDAQLQGSNGFSVWYSGGTTYKFFKDKITLAVMANNFLKRTNEWRSESEDANFRRSFSYFNVQRGINFSLRWNFGKLSESVSRKRGVSNDDLKGKN
jgi:outer membrane receptor protein involved in Fe transport